MRIKVKRIGIMFLIIAGVLLVMLMSMFIKAAQEAGNLAYDAINMNDIPDGVYHGLAETTLVKGEVEVEVKGHEIVRIDLLKHDNGLGSKAESIIEDMIRENTYDVDEISGATVSSKVIKSAVSDALVKGKE